MLVQHSQLPALNLLEVKKQVLENGIQLNIPRYLTWLDLFPTGSTIFYNFHRPAKMFVKSNLFK
jgi:hypothetical protein